MPELPEVETVVRELQCLEGKRVSKVDVIWERSVEGSVAIFKQTITGAKILKVWRRGKYIVCDTDRDCHLTIHLRMTGKVVFVPNGKDKAYVRVKLECSEGTKLFFVDVRKFGKWKMWPQNKVFLPDLGPEPLESDAVFKALSGLKTHREIKKVLLDQRVLAGVGNIYADEALFIARIHPSREACSLKKSEVQRLAEHIPLILKASIKNMGTTLSDYRNTKNVGGENQNYLKVYGQTGEACKICKTAIEKMTIGARTSHFCPKCQK